MNDTKRNVQSDKNPKKKVTFSELWKNKRLRSIFISVAVILLCVIIYVVLLFTVLKPDEVEQKPTIGNHGEEMANGRPFVLNPVTAEQVQGVRVDNEFGGFYYYRGEDDAFYFEGAESIIYDSASDWMTGESSGEVTDVLSNVSMTESLMSMIRYMLATEEVIGYDKNNLAAYGLEGDGQAKMTLSYLDDDGNLVENSVIYGYPIVSGSGYYCMLEGRDAVYILQDTYISRCIFTDVKSYFYPQVAPAVPSTAYTAISKMIIKKKGEEFLSLRKATDEEYKESGEMFSHIFLNPDGYFPSTENLATMLEIFTNFKGEEVVEFDIIKLVSDPAEKDRVTEMFKKYSLMDSNNNWIYELYFDYESFDCTVYISEKLKVLDGNEETENVSYIYYVYSPDYDVIVEFKAEDLDWVEWDLLTYMDNHSFAVSIDKVASIEMAFDKTDVKFSLLGESDQLKITSSTGAPIDTENFRELYKAILYSTVDGYADKPDEATSILKLKITLRDGNVFDFEFFGLTARKAFYTLNGSGQFYINRDYIKQLIYACNGLLNGEDIVVDRKN